MKQIVLALAALAMLAAAKGAAALPIKLTFEGVVTGFTSYHQDYDISDFGAVVGVTPLRYVFQVDFDAANTTTSNGAGTWNYFYSDLLSIPVVTGGQVTAGHYGFNWFRASGPNIGQITSFLDEVRISTTAAATPNWQVQDWQLGQHFTSLDAACYPGGISGCAVYLYGDVALTAIEPIPVPSSAVLMLVAVAGLGAGRFRGGRRPTSRS